MERKTKSLHSLTFDGCNFFTQLRYNTNTEYIAIITTHYDRKKYYEDNKDKSKQYHEDNKDKRKQYYRNAIEDPLLSRGRMNIAAKGLSI